MITRRHINKLLTPLFIKLVHPLSKITDVLSMLQRSLDSVQISANRFVLIECRCLGALALWTMTHIGIFEIMHLNEGLKNLILKTYDATQIKQYALQGRMKTLRQSGIEKVLAGKTTIEEVLRVTQQ